MKRATLIVLLLCSGFTGASDKPDAYASVKALGELNGIALNCRYIGEVRRMKTAVIENAPKERSYGIAFDESTNASFLAFVSSGKLCPGEAGFSERIDQAIERLKADLSDT